MDHANGSPQGYYLHWPWQWVGTSHTGTFHTCAWHNPYKRAGSPNPLLTFWLDVTQVASRSRHLSQTLSRSSVHLTLTSYLFYLHVDLHLSIHSPAEAWQPHMKLKLLLVWRAIILASYKFKLQKAPACLLAQQVGVQNRAVDHRLGHIEWNLPAIEKV